MHPKNVSFLGEKELQQWKLACIHGRGIGKHFKTTSTLKCINTIEQEGCTIWFCGGFTTSFVCFANTTMHINQG